MLIQLSDLIGFEVQSEDMRIGILKDILFNDFTKDIQFFDVDTSSWFRGRRLLFQPSDVFDISWQNEEIELKVTRKQIDTAPGPENHPPVSRQWLRLVKQFHWPQYALSNLASYNMLFPIDDKDFDSKNQKTIYDKNDPHLRSLYEVIGYDIETDGEQFGSLKDLIADPQTYKIRYLSLFSRRWLPGPTHLVPSPMLDHFDFSEGFVAINSKRKYILSSPRASSSVFISKRMEEVIHSHYGILPYWVSERQKAHYRTAN